MDGCGGNLIPLMPRDLSELRRLSRVFGTIVGLDKEAAIDFEKGLLERAKKQPFRAAKLVREGQASYRIASRLQPDPLPGVLHIEAGSGTDAEPLWLFNRVSKLVRCAGETERITVVITGLERYFVGPRQRWSHRRREGLSLLRERIESLVFAASTARTVTIIFA